MAVGRVIGTQRVQSRGMHKMDKVVAVTSHRGYVLIFMESGRIYRMENSELDFKVSFSLIAEVPKPH